MKKLHIYYIILSLLGIYAVAGCTFLEDVSGYGSVPEENLINPYCIIENSTARNYASGTLGTKSLINQTTSVDTILCNFLRIEEHEADVFSQNNNYTTNWGDANISEGTIATVPNNLTNNLRSVSLYPELPYNSEANKVSRMVGWYPRTNTLPEDSEGETVNIQFSSFEDTYIADNEYIGVRFTALDGSKDIMVSDLRDGSLTDPYDSENFFTFKHYLSAIRVYAKAERSSQDISLWGEINEVIIMRQPTSCVIALPQEPSNSNVEKSFGEIREWGNENAKFPIQKGYMFGEKDTGAPNNTVAEEYPISLQGNSIEKYLGYSLIKPGEDLRIQVHTNAGIYDVNVPKDYNSSEIFQPGYIYDIHLDFKTDGTIFAFLENEGDKKYFDLTKGDTYTTDSDIDGEGNQTTVELYNYKYANCYIIESEPSGNEEYDGFCFDATVVGNGESGILSTGAQTFYPTNAHISPYTADILWETSPRLITQVELLFGHVRFKVAKEGNNYKKGNAVIAVYDSEKNILWSWHIWITDTPKDITYKEGNTSITIMDRNLGATFGDVPTTDALALESYGLYYQWGRKDPSMGPPEWNYSPINMITAPYYDYSSDKKTAAEVVRFAAPTLKDAVENPMYLIMPTAQTQTYYFNWLYEKIDFLWGYSISTGNTHKTIYDPCPYGYRVSGGEIADLFAYATEISTTGSFDVSSEYGQKVSVPKETGSSEKSEFFFPYTGFKGVDRGLNSLVSSWKYVGEKGDYQSSVVSRYTGDQEYYMHRARTYISKATNWDELNVGSYTGRQIQDHTNRRTAAPVRCVLDENHNRVRAFITPDIRTISGQNSVVRLTMFAESFNSKIASAKLSIAYHLKNQDGSEGEHKEYVIEEWDKDSNTDPTNAKLWQPGVFEFQFNNLKEVTDGNATANTIDIEQTTGNFRFILHVKSEDNINRISSTTITKAANYIGFGNWDNNNEVYVGEPITREFNLYGSSTPTKVEMIPVRNNGSGDYSIGESIDITEQYRSLQSSEYNIDRIYSTSDLLSYSNKGWNGVYFKVTYANGEVTEYKTEGFVKWFKVYGIAANQANSITDAGNKIYMIKHYNHGYLYDNGTNLNNTSNYSYTNFFRLVPDNSNYKVQNLQSADYATVSSVNFSMQLTITEKSANSATSFTFSPNNSNLYNIFNYPNYYRYSWRMQNKNADVSLERSNDNYVWQLYEVSKESWTSGENPPDIMSIGL